MNQHKQGLKGDRVTKQEPLDLEPVSEQSMHDTIIVTEDPARPCEAVPSLP